MSHTNDALPLSASDEIRPTATQGTIERLSLEREELVRQVNAKSLSTHTDNSTDVAAAPGDSALPHSSSMSSESLDTSHALHAQSLKSSSPNPRKAFSFSDWRWEIFSWAVGTMALLVLLMLLGVFKDRSLSSWHSKISVNAMVSALGQLAQSAFAVSLANCLGQLKWNWLRIGKNMSDIEIFDEASRGPLGSMVLIWEQGFKARTLHLALLGAFTTALMVVFTTFTQQAVSTDVRVVQLGTNVTILRTTNYDLDAKPISSVDGQSLIQAAMDGFIKDQINLPMSLTTCLSGSCIWQDYASLGFCSVVNSTVQHMNISCESLDIDADCNFDAPDPAMFSFLSQYGESGVSVCEAALLMTSNWTREDTLNLYILLPSSSPGCTLSDGFSAGFGADAYKGNNDSFAVIQASIQICVQNHSTNATNGVLADSISTSIPLLDAPDWHWDQNRSCGTTGNITACFDPVVANHDQASLGGYRAYLEFDVFNILSSLESSADEGSAYSVSSGSPLIGGALMQDLDPTMTRLNNSFPIDALRKRLDIVATSLSLGLRNHSGSPLSGIETSTELYIKVEIPWLILPVALWLFASVFLLATIIITHTTRTPVWKSSPLILLQCMDVAPKLLSAHVVTKESKRSSEIVELEDSTGRWRLGRLPRNPKIQ